jgi:outer membrane immunogenic protein
MKTIFISLIFVLAATNAGRAADLPASKQAPVAVAYVAPSFTWSGFYLGADAGGSFGDVSVRNDSYNTAPFPPPPAFINERPANFHFSSEGFVGGVEGGYNIQSGSIVGGVEADASASSQVIRAHETTVPTAALIANYPGYILEPSYLTVKQSSPFFGTLRARLGVAPINRLLIFATGGLAVATYDYSVLLQHPLEIPLSATKSDLRAGGVLGGGVEYAFTNNWSMKAEYLYAALGKTTVIFSPSPITQRRFAMDENQQIARLGVNYHF